MANVIEDFEDPLLEIERLRHALLDSQVNAREIELLLWKCLADEGGSATIPYVQDLPDRYVRFIRHERSIECAAMGSSDTRAREEDV